MESGLAAGVVAAAELAKALGERRVVSFDMGGTTAKAGVVVDFEPSITTEYEVVIETPGGGGCGASG